MLAQRLAAGGALVEQLLPLERHALALLERQDMAAFTHAFEHYRIEYERRQRIAARVRSYIAGDLPPHCTAMATSAHPS